MTDTPIKSTLFKFATIRNPHLVAGGDPGPGFVLHPDPSQSVFIQSVNSAQTEAERLAALNTTSSSFSAFATRAEVRAVNPDLFQFSAWLMKNKNSLSYTAIASNASGVLPLTSLAEYNIWDNLYHQTNTNESDYVRDALIQLLVANQFLKNFQAVDNGGDPAYVFTEEELEPFTRSANAKVVISSLVAFRQKTFTANTPYVNPQARKAFHDSLEAAMTSERLAALETTIRELKHADKIHRKESSESYKRAIKRHNSAVKKLYEKTEPTIEIIIDPETGQQEKRITYPGLELPEFNFAEAEIDERFLSKTISSTSLDIVKNLSLLDTCDKMSDIIKNVEAEAKKDSEFILQTTSKSRQVINYRGYKLKPGQTGTLTQYYCSLHYREYPRLGSRLRMKINTGYQVSSVTNVQYQLTGSFGAPLSYNQVQISISATDQQPMFRFFPNATLNLGGQAFQLSGEMTLDNGIRISFNASWNPGDALFVDGICGVLDGNGDPVDPASPATDLYGVTNLGIADFRKVEQEVCCYVPGEVSHIENILAKEYKERATRRLTSIESTTEDTTERETEQLSDTTTTERNELQKEISSILVEDKSKTFGASAEVSGSYPGSGITFGASATGNFSSSSSSTDSNSISQTYAKEVSERAMERVVEKVSSKRTSKILREFEENNKHGFDNRGANATNVTGIYRWVDKIYTNKLVNYGKRLMFEFAVPEPARFFKEAIIKEVTEAEVPQTIVPMLPPPPNSLSYPNTLNHPGNITRSNYQAIAGYYGAEIISPPLATVHISKAIDATIRGDGHNETDNSFSDSVTIPPNYTCSKAYVRGGFYRHGNSSSGTNITITVGNDEDYHYSEDTSYVHTFYFSSQDIVEELGVSIRTRDMGTVALGVTAECKLTDEAFEQWQNETFREIMDAYQERVRIYNEYILGQSIEEADVEEKVTFNPLFNRAIEKRELKRVCIELITEPYNIQMGRNHYTVNTNSIPKVNKTAILERHASEVKFFEQAFEWDTMAYIFYPYFWAEEENGKWIKLFQESDPADPIFQAFLQSGMARVVAAVRPGFEDAVAYYMETGEIWNGQGLVIDTDDDLYISIAEELATIDGEVEATWETRLPTSLTILQANSAPLQENGLPCCHPDSIRLGSGDSQLSGSDGSGVGTFVVS